MATLRIYSTNKSNSLLYVVTHDDLGHIVYITKVIPQPLLGELLLELEVVDKPTKQQKRSLLYYIKKNYELVAEKDASLSELTDGVISALISKLANLQPIHGETVLCKFV